MKVVKKKIHKFGHQMEKKIKNLGQNGDIPFSHKTYSKMSLLWNYLGKCPYFKLDFLKIDFQWKTRFLENWVIGNQTLKINK